MRRPASRMVRLLALLAGALLLSACASPREPASTTAPAPAPASAPATVLELAPGTRLQLTDGSGLAYARLASDSRCPTDATCIHAGWAEAEFVHAPRTGPERVFLLSTRAEGAAFTTGGWRFELVELDRGASPPAAIRLTRAAD